MWSSRSTPEQVILELRLEDEDSSIDSILRGRGLSEEAV